MNENQKTQLKAFLGDYINEITKKSVGKDQYVCPFCGSGTGPNGTGAFTYYPETQTYNCFKCSENGDIFTLYAHENHLDCNSDFLRIVEELSAKYGVNPEPHGTSSQASPVERQHVYRNPDGSIFAKKIILKYPDGNKRVRWSLFDAPTGSYLSGGLAGQKAPLYNADLLHSRKDSTVYITEGEKDSDFLVSLGFISTTTPNGASFSNWLDLYNDGLQNRDIVIITDNDSAGRQYGETVAKNVQKIAKSVKIVPSEKIYDKCPKKGDISDISAIVGEEQTYHLLLNAVGSAPIEPKPEPLADVPKIVYTPIRLTDVQPEKREFLWNPYIPIGEITVMFAAGGTGKSFATVGISADITAGRTLPRYNEEQGRTTPEKVLFISAEDTAGIIRSRMQKIYGNTDNCVLIKTPMNRQELEEDSFLLPQNKDDKPRIEAFANLLTEIKPKLVIIDPWSVYLGDDKNMNKANDVRAVTTVLTTLAKEFNCAMLIVAHVNKMPQMENANNAVSGSTALIDSARSALCIRSLGAESDKRVIIHTKANYSKKGKSVCYRIVDEGDGETARFQWDGFSDLTEDDLTSSARTGKRLADIVDEKEDEAENTQTIVDVITRLAQHGKKIPISYSRFRDEIEAECGFNFCNQPKKEIYKVLSELRSRGISIEFPKGTLRGLTKDGKHENNSKGFYIIFA